MKKQFILVIVFLGVLIPSISFSQERSYYTRVYSVEPMYSESHTREPVVIGTTLVCERSGNRMGTGSLVGGIGGGWLGSTARGRARLPLAIAGVLIGSNIGSQFDSHQENCYERDII